MSRDMFIGIFTTDDCGCKNGVGGCEAGCDDETREEVEAWDEGVDESRRDEPALKNGVRLVKGHLRDEGTHPCHYWTQQEEDALPVSSHIRLGQFDSYSEDTDC